MVLVSLGSAAPAALASDASGCAGSAISYREDSSRLDSVNVPGPDGTKDNPFIVDPRGAIAWEGHTTALITAAKYRVSAAGIPWSGTFANTEKKTSASGKEDIPLLVAPLLEGQQVVYVSANVTGTGGTCTASIWISSHQDPTLKPMWLAGLALIVIALMLLLWMFFDTSYVFEVSDSGQANFHPTHE